MATVPPVDSLGPTIVALLRSLDVIVPEDLKPATLWGRLWFVLEEQGYWLAPRNPEPLMKVLAAYGVAIPPTVSSQEILNEVIEAYNDDLRSAEPLIPNLRARAAEILRRPYSLTFKQDRENGRYSAEILEFPGCFADGATLPLAQGHLMIAAEAWVLSMLDRGKPVPEPFESVGRIVKQGIAPPLIVPPVSDDYRDLKQWLWADGPVPPLCDGASHFLWWTRSLNRASKVKAQDAILPAFRKSLEDYTVLYPDRLDLRRIHEAVTSTAPDAFGEVQVAALHAAITWAFSDSPSAVAEVESVLKLGFPAS